MSFSRIIGQEKALRMLSGAITKKRIASAYLFCGEPGIGKKDAALSFAKTLNCLKIPETSRNEACDTCDSCNKIGAGTHPDFLFITPEERQIRVEEIRLIDNALSFKPFESRIKVVIVADAETMNISAANAFLKTLEEPPSDSVIILISSNPEILPATILSRCSRINFVPLSQASCRQVLVGKVPEANLELAVRLSMGRPGIALSTDLREERERFLSLFRDMLRAEKDSWISREEMEHWFEYALLLLRDIASLKISGEKAGLINIDIVEYLDELSKSNELKGIITIHKELVRVKRLLMFNLNKSITWNYISALLRKELLFTNA